MSELLTELTANLIEVSKYSGYPEGMLGAIRYISETERSKLRTDIEMGKIMTNLPLFQIDEARIIQEFEKDIINNKLTISLESKEQSERIHLLIEPISRLFSQRNHFNQKELEKLEILKNPNNVSEYMVTIHFGYNRQEQEYFIRNIQILRKKTPEQKHEKHLNQYLDNSVA
ncbi:MAG: hypothetical protein WC774_00030 [Candidatus Gracilibacteria bacterium]|jgi:hypothetical protein